MAAKKRKAPNSKAREFHVERMWDVYRRRRTRSKSVEPITAVLLASDVALWIEPSLLVRRLWASLVSLRCSISSHGRSL